MPLGATRATILALALCASGALALDPQEEADGLATAREALEAGRAGEAVTLLTELLAEPGADERAVRLLLSEAQIAAGAADQAVEAITPLVEGGGYDVLLLAGRAYKAWGEQMQRDERSGDDVGFAFDEARSYLDQAVKKASRSETAAAIELGNLELYTLGDHEAALGRAEKLLDNDSGNAEARLLRGCALLWASIKAADGGDEAQAAELRGRAIDDVVAAQKDLPQTRPEPWVQLAWLYEADGKPDQAVEAAIAALERQPQGSVGTLYHLAQRYSAERNFPAAAAALDAMVRKDARGVTDLLRAEADPTAAALALSYAVGPMVEANELARARDALAAIVGARPQHVDPWNNYAFLCRETRKYEEAFEAYEQALGFQPDNPRLLNDAGLILHYYLHRDYDRAQEYYEQAIEKADAELARTDLEPAQRAELEVARTDAVGNLKQLAEGDYTWP